MSEEGRVALKGASHPLVLSLLSLSVFRFRREEITKKAVSEWVQIHLDGRADKYRARDHSREREGGREGGRQS